MCLICREETRELNDRIYDRHLGSEEKIFSIFEARTWWIVFGIVVAAGVFITFFLLIILLAIIVK